MYQRKDSRYYRLIQSARWLQLRARKLNAQPLCENCLQAGMYTAACEVHHIRPAELSVSDSELERLMFDWSNLQALCHACHVNEHRNMHSHSAAAQRERQQARTERFIGRYFGDGSGKTGDAFLFQAPSCHKSPAEKQREILELENPVGGTTLSRPQK